MKTRIHDQTAPYQTISSTSRITGLSQTYLRGGVRAGTIPHVRSGSVYLINVPLLLAQLEADARRNGGEAVE